MKKHFRIVTAIFIVLLTSVSCAANSEKEKAASEAALTWLAIVDSGKYSESWQEAAAYFQNAVPKNQWEQMLQSVREPLGKIISRKIKNTVFKTSLPGAPDGQYVIIQFQTSFQNKKSAVETVTPMLDSDGRWRVSGYFIK